MPTFAVTDPTVQAAVIKAAVEIAKSMFKPEAVNPQKVALVAKELTEQLKRSDDPK